MTTSTRTAAFARLASQFQNLLRAATTEGTEDAAWNSENFLDDFGVEDSDARAYEARWAGATALENWAAKHVDYLVESGVYRRRDRAAMMEPPPAVIDADRVASSSRVFLRGGYERTRLLDEGVMLLNVFRLREPARIVGMDPEGVRAAAQRRGEARLTPTAGADAFTDFLDVWNRKCELRPVYSTLWANHAHLFPDPDDPSQDQPGRLDLLCARLGLRDCMRASATAPATPVVVFRYPVAHLPRHRSLRDGRRPLRVPSVLDGGLNAAFFPVPERADVGCPVDLEARAAELVSEFVHPPIRLRPAHFFRYGEVTAMRPTTLIDARAWHRLLLGERWPAADRSEAS